MIKFAAITPHPPIIIPGIGKSSDLKLVQKTIISLEKLAEKISEYDIDTVIIISPHGVIYPDRMNIWYGGEFSGNFSQFNAPQIKFDFSSDDDLAKSIIKQSDENGIKCNANSENFVLDHGVLVPMYYLQKHLDEDIKIVPINYSMFDRLQHYAFGQTIYEICNQDPFKDKNIAIIASGDLSHRLFEGNTGKEFDKNLIDDLKAKDSESILNMDENFIQDAGECGYRSILILLGALEKMSWQPDVLSYEGPYGVGYLVANFVINDTNITNKSNQ